MHWIWTYLRTSGDNFHEVVPGRIYRSATPSPENLEKYRRKFGIKTWLDLRMPKDYRDSSFLAAQCAIAKRLGIERISLPLDDFGVVSDEQIRVGLEILTDESRQPLLFGCKGNRHRASLLCAMYRMRVCGWTAEQAMEEAENCGYYPNGHRTFDKRFRQLLGLLLVLLLFVVPAMGQKAVPVDPHVELPSPIFGTPAVMTPENFRIVQAQPHPFIHLDQSAAAIDRAKTLAPPQSDIYKEDAFNWGFWTTSGLWLGASTADLVTTKFALDRGGFERNPLHALEGGHKLRWTSAIAATAGTFAFSAYCERKGHRRVARIVLITGAIVRTGLAFWNNSRRR